MVAVLLQFAAVVVVVVEAAAVAAVGAEDGRDERLIAVPPLTSDEPSMQSMLDSSWKSRIIEILQ